MLKNFYFLFALLLSLNLVACSSENDDPGTEPPGTEEGGNSNGTDQTDDLSNPKQYFETTATKVMELFNASDQKQALELVGFYCNNYAEYEVEFDDEYVGRPLSNFVKNAERSIKTGHYARIKASDLYYFADYSGVFEPNDDTYCWERTSDSNDLIFKFSHLGSACELKIVASSDIWSVELDNNDRVEVPKTLTVTLTEGKTTLLTSTVESNYNSSNHTVNATVNTTVANINVKCVINGTDSQITANQTTTIGGTTLATANSIIKGNNLCDRTKIENAIENEDDEALKTFFSNATGESDILGRIQVKAEVKSLYEIIKADDDRWDAYDEAGWSSEAEEKIEKTYANTMNSYVKCSFYFARNGEKQGDIIFKAMSEEYYGNTYWDTYMVLQFNDGSTYDFESYFGEGNFHSTETQFTDLVETYESILNID